MSDTNVTAVMVMVLTLVSCCANVLLLEKIVKDAPRSPALVTVAVYVGIILENLITKPKVMVDHVIPIKSYIIITALFYSTSLLNNMALSYNVSMPTLLIFRSGSLMANMIVSLIAFRRIYPLSKYVSVAMVTLGIIIATMASASEKSKEIESDNGGFGTWLLGISMITYALFGSAIMGVFQEKLFATYGKQKDEALFFTHLLGLPGFLLNTDAIMAAVATFNSSPPLQLAGVVQVPWLWCLIVVNVALNMMCIKSVYFLLSEWSSLSVTMVLTLRKFLSLLLSIYIFNNAFTLSHWCGTVLVFAGSALFSGLIPLPSSREKKE